MDSWIRKKKMLSSQPSGIDYKVFSAKFLEIYQKKDTQGRFEDTLAEKLWVSQLRCWHVSVCLSKDNKIVLSIPAQQEIGDYHFAVS